MLKLRNDMRIAHVVSTFSPRVGGMGEVCYNEARLLAESGHDVTVFTLKYPGAVYENVKFPFRVARLKPWIRLGDAGLVPQILNRLVGFDLVHLHYPFYGGAEWLSFSTAPMVITYHMDAQTSGVKAFIGKIYDWLWPKILFTQAKKIIAVDAGHAKNTKLGKLFADKIVEIPNGVDTDIFHPHSVDLAKLGLADLENKKIILFVGNPMPLKRLDLLLRAVKLLNDNNLALVVVGGGYELENYKQIARDLAIENSVHFVGQCNDRQKLSDYYNAAACVAVPSDYESFSLVVAEAMACGRPLVVSDIEGLRNRTDQAFLFAKGSAEGLADAVKKCLSLSPEEREKISRLESAEATTKYSWEKHMEKLISLYERV